MLNRRDPFSVSMQACTSNYALAMLECWRALQRDFCTDKVNVNKVDRILCEDVFLGLCIYKVDINKKNWLLRDRI